MGEVNKWVADLSDESIRAYTNRGFGPKEKDISRTERGIEFETGYSLESFPMYAIDFSEYLEQEDLRIEDMTSFEMVAGAYDREGNELDFSMEYERCAFVSEEALDGYSDSDILPKGNYKSLGSGLRTKFDLTSYTGYTADGTDLTESSLEDGVGFNVQLVNGDITKVDKFIISEIVFLKDDAKLDGTKEIEKNEKQETRQATRTIEADLMDDGVIGYVNIGDGIVQDGVNKFDGIIQFEYGIQENYPMIALDFKKYLESKNIKMDEIVSFAIRFGCYDADMNEIDYTKEFQKCSYVTEKSLNGYGSSDILSADNYKIIGSNIKTVFDLTKFDGSMPATIEDGVGFNIQIVNGANRDQISSFVLFSLQFALV